MKITRYIDEYIDVNGHNFIGVHGIVENRVALHVGCPHGSTMITVEDGAKLGPDDYGVCMAIDLGHDDNGKSFCTITLEGEFVEKAKRMEEVIGRVTMQ